MRIENLIYLINGELKNSPSVFEIANFTDNAKDVKRGSLFFAKNKNDIEEAVKNGAYAIVFESFTQIIDSEIAWIKVENLQNAALKLLRFFLIQENTPIINVDKISYEIAKLIKNSNEILFIDNDFIKNFINFYKNDIKVAFIYDKGLLKNIALDLYTIENKRKIEPINSYIFESSFILNGKYFERVQFSPIFIKELDNVINIFDSFKIEYNIKNIENFSHFKPFFINKNFEILEHGKSDKVLILENERSLLNREREFLENSAKWAKKLYISDKEIKGFNFIKDFDKICKILHNSYFNYALISVEDFEIDRLKIEKNIKTLF